MNPLNARSGNVRVRGTGLDGRKAGSEKVEISDQKSEVRNQRSDFGLLTLRPLTCDLRPLISDLRLVTADSPTSDLWPLIYCRTALAEPEIFRSRSHVEYARITVHPA